MLGYWVGRHVGHGRREVVEEEVCVWWWCVKGEWVWVGGGRRKKDRTMHRCQEQLGGRAGNKGGCSLTELQVKVRRACEGEVDRVGRQLEVLRPTAMQAHLSSNSSEQSNSREVSSRGPPPRGSTCSVVGGEDEGGVEA